MSQNTEHQFFLPKKAQSSNLTREDPSQITKTIRLHIEDFFERLKDNFNRLEATKGHFIKSPTFPIGDEKGYLGIFVDGENVYLDVSEDHDGVLMTLQSIEVTGVCGSLSIAKSTADWSGNGFLYVELGSVEEMKEAMISSGNHKLDLHVTLILKGKADVIESEWIIPRYKTL